MTIDVVTGIDKLKESAALCRKCHTGMESNVKRVIPHYYKAFYKEMARIRATADTNVRRKLVTLNCIKSMCRLLLGNLQPFAVVAL